MHAGKNRINVGAKSFIRIWGRTHQGRLIIGVEDFKGSMGFRFTNKRVRHVYFRALVKSGSGSLGSVKYLLEELCHSLVRICRG